MSLFTSPDLLLFVLLGTLLGIVVGGIPGLTGAMLIALTLPLTYTMSPDAAMTLMIAMYVGSVSGGLITATLWRMPGTPASMMTTLDGYPMAQSGNPGRALALGIYASLFGGVISWGFLVLLSRPIALMASRFGPFELASLVLLALTLMAFVGGNSLVRSLFAGCLGIVLSMPGISTSTGEARWTFGFTELNDGFELLPVLIGLFAVNQVFKELGGGGTVAQEVTWKDGLRLHPGEGLVHSIGALRSALVGTVIGILPGIGANIGSVTSYSIAKRLSKEPERFGKGSAEGIVAAESANNATVGGALIPLVSMGLPGSVIDAILLGALIVHGLQPGPRLFADHPELVSTMMNAYLLSNFVMAALMWGIARKLSRLVEIPKWVLLPTLLVCCVVGSFALSHRMFDVWVMLIAGLVGYWLEKAKIPLAPLVIGFVLGPIAEENLSAALMSSQGSWLPFLLRPIAAGCITLTVVLLVWPMVFRRKGRQQ